MAPRMQVRAYIYHDHANVWLNDERGRRVKAVPVSSDPYLAELAAGLGPDQSLYAATRRHGGTLGVEWTLSPDGPVHHRRITAAELMDLIAEARGLVG